MAKPYLSPPKMGEGPVRTYRPAVEDYLIHEFAWILYKLNLVGRRGDLYSLLYFGETVKPMIVKLIEGRGR